MPTVPTPAQIAEQENIASETQDSSRWPGMTYEQGVVNALRWVTGNDDTAPMEEN